MSGRVKKAAAPKKKANGYKMPAPIPPGEIIHDTINKTKWRLGPSIAVGGFGEIYSACEVKGSPSKAGNYAFVIKIEPHENGPIFIEKNFYTRNANKADIEKFMKDKKLTSLGMPLYYGKGTHEYNGEKYRFLVLERFGENVANLLSQCKNVFPPSTVFLLALQILDVLEYIHSRGYVHADIKGGNILIGLKKGMENQAYLVDFGLATRITDEKFKPNPKCAHNGTIEYTSRDAHLGEATMRGDLEILAYNMLQWLGAKLPWEKCLKQPQEVQAMKEAFMKNVRREITKQFTNIPEALIQFFEYINSLKHKDNVNYAKCKQIFEGYLKSQRVPTNSKLEFTNKQRRANKLISKGEIDSDTQNAEDNVLKKNASKENGNVKVTKRGRRLKLAVEEENSENEEPEVIDDVEPVKRGRKAKVAVAEEDGEDDELKGRGRKVAVRAKKRKSVEPSVVVKVKRTKMAPKATPPLKKNHANIATQTSIEVSKRNPRQVSFDSPISAVIGEAPAKGKCANTSADIFDDSFELEDKKVKQKRKLLSKEEVIVKRVVRRKVTAAQPKKSWRDASTVVNGRSPPK